MSPVSIAGSDWSGSTQFQTSQSGTRLSSAPSNRSALATPPTSGGPSFGQVEPNATLPSSPATRRQDNPSPPSSVASRSRVSDGTLSDQKSARYKRMEETLSQHYQAFRRFLQTPLRDEMGNPRMARARDKLLRLSAGQFEELSTDVYDELLRRQAASPASGSLGTPKLDVPPHLPPQPEFHAKRNQARQKLSTLPPPKFKELASDVLGELERRFPHFSDPDVSRSTSPTSSVRGGYGAGVNGHGSRPESSGQMAYGYPPRSQSRGPPLPGGRGFLPPGPPMPPAGRFPPRQGSLGGLSSGGLRSNGEVIPENAPFPKSLQSNTIVPNKSTLVEDDDETVGPEEDSGRRSDAFSFDQVLQSRRETETTMAEQDRKLLADAQSQVSSLQEKVKELEGLIGSMDQELTVLRDAENTKSAARDKERKEWDQLKTDLLRQLSDAQNLSSSLQLELTSVRQDQQNMEQELRQRLDTASRGDSDDGDWKVRFEDLHQKYQSLKTEFIKQQDLTEQVRRDASNFLQEMKSLSEQSGANWEREEKLNQDVHRLEEEVKRWKSRYAKTKTQLKHLRTSSLGLSGHRHDAGTFVKENELTSADGLVKDVDVTKFQMSIDELLQIARSGEPSRVLEQMKAVVLAVRRITRDIETAQGEGDEPVQSRVKAKSRVSTTANNLITASKNFANSSGISPISLLDAAASHLSAAVVELIRAVGIRPTPAEELGEDDEEDYLAPMQSPGYFSVAPSQGRLSGNDSVYSAISSPPSVRSMSQTSSRPPVPRDVPVNGQGLLTGVQLDFGGRGHYNELTELKLYLDDQTQDLVQSIQALISSVRAEHDIHAVRAHVNAISSIVNKVVSSVENSISQSDSNPALRDRTDPTIQSLLKYCERLEHASADDGQALNPAQLREVTNRLPPIAFELARVMKELQQQVEHIDFDGGEDENFR